MNLKFFRNNLIIILISIFIVNSKHITQDINFDNFKRNPFQFLSKFTVGSNGGIATFKASLSNPVHESRYWKSHINIPLLLFNYDNWEKVQGNTKDCSSKLAYAIKKYDVNIPIRGDYSDLLNFTFESDSGNPQVWLIALADCERQLWFYTMDGNAKLNYDLSIFNNQNSHFSAEEDGILNTNLISFACLALFFLINLSQLYKLFISKEISCTNPILLATIAIFFEMLSTLCEIGHLYIYEHDGLGNYWLDISNQIFTVLSQYLITLLLIAIGSGWTIHYEYLKELDIYIPALIITGIANILTVMMSRLENEVDSKYHDYDNIPGFVIMLVRTTEWIIFINLVKKSLEKQTEITYQKDIQSFYLRFGLTGTVYLLTFPILVTFSTIFIAPYFRHQFIIIGNLILQILASCYLTYLFIVRTSKYNKVYCKNKLVLLRAKLS